MILLSRRGVPAFARPRPQAHRTAPVPTALTADAVGALRGTDSPLDFDRDVWPLVLREMATRYEAVEQRRAAVDDPATRPCGPTRDDLIAMLSDVCHPSADPGALLDADRYAQWYRGELERDLAEARRGIDGSPLKAAVETLRDCRDALRSAVDNPGLDPASADRFFGRFVPAVNRLVIGPQAERHAELLALLEAGVVRMGPGPGAVIERGSGSVGADQWQVTSTGLDTPARMSLDALVSAHSPAPDLERGDAMLRSLIEQRRAVPCVRAHAIIGLRVDDEHRLVGAHGAASEGIFVLGPLAEGSSYYNHYVATPGAPSRSVRDAGTVARRVIGVVRARTATERAAVPAGGSSDPVRPAAQAIYSEETV